MSLSRESELSGRLNVATGFTVCVRGNTSCHNHLFTTQVTCISAQHDTATAWHPLHASSVSLLNKRLLYGVIGMVMAFAVFLIVAFANVALPMSNVAR